MHSLLISSEQQFYSITWFQYRAYGKSAGAWHILPISPSTCRFQHRQEQKEGKNFVVSLMQETHPSPTDRQRHGTAPGGQLVKQGEKKI